MALCDAERAHRDLCVAAMSTNIEHPEVIRCMFLHAGYAPKTYLSSLPALDAARQLIDAFRLRCEDEYVFNMEYTGLYSQEPGEPRKAFWTYLDLAEKRKVVPTWWNLSTRRRVEQMAMDEKGAHCIRHAVERSDIVELYGGDGLAPLKLRGVAEKVYGRPVTNHF
jgi:splicing suppressor protein 51